MTSHEHSLAAKTVSKRQPSKSMFQDKLFRIAGTSEAETWVSGKAECSLAMSEDKKSKVSGVSCSFIKP